MFGLQALHGSSHTKSHFQVRKKRKEGEAHTIQTNKESRPTASALSAKQNLDEHYPTKNGNDGDHRRLTTGQRKPLRSTVIINAKA